MKHRYLVVFLLLTLVPAGLIVWLGWRVSAEEQHRTRREFIAVIDESLQTHRQIIEDRLADRFTDLLQVVETARLADTAGRRELARTHPWVRQCFEIGPRGRIVFPSRSQLTEAEQNFLMRTATIWQERQPFRLVDEYGSRADSGWHTWYWSDGPHYILWLWHPATDHVYGIEVERMRLVSEVLAALPTEGQPHVSIPSEAQIQLRDPSGRVVYRWGRAAVEADASPITSIALNAPLTSWTLSYYTGRIITTRQFSSQTLINTLAILLGTLALLSGLAIYFYRSMTTQMRDAAQRVTFVNQVSHELKTPLTNIRMYAELLERSLDPDDERRRKHLDVIVGESQRLSRLIGNVLTFSKSKQGKLSIHPQTGCIDETICRLIEPFRQKVGADFSIEQQLDAQDDCQFDSDVLEQILTNLLSNVEKYAISGDYLSVSSSLSDGLCEIRVTDRGPGVPTSKQELIFQPFERLSDKLSEAAGTGIGLSIARSLARLHGGDLSYLATDSGSCFKLTLRVSP